MSKKRSIFETVFYIVSKIILVIFLPPAAIIGGIIYLILLLIDTISRKEDETHLSYSETKKRDTDRKNARRHWYFEFMAGYIKELFS